MTRINDAVIQESDIFIYNLGTVFVIDRVLFVDQERIGQVLAKNADRIPSFGLVQPDGVASSSDAGKPVDPPKSQDSSPFVEEVTESTAGKFVVRE